MSPRYNTSLKVLVILGLCFINNSNKAYGQQNENTTTTVNIEEQALQVMPTDGYDVIATQEPLEADPVIERSSHYSHGSDPTLHGFWKKKLTWRPRWVKTWQAKKVYVAVWKKMWGPAMLKEWIPIPKPPPGWLKHKAYGPGTVYAHPHPYL